MPDLGAEFLNDPLFRSGAAEGLQRASIDQDPALVFLERLRANVMASLDKGPVTANLPPTIFIAVKHPRAENDKLGGLKDRLLLLDSKAPADWAGRVVFVAENGVAGWSRVLTESAEAIFDWLEKEGLGRAPVAVVDAGKRLMTCFPEGAANEVYVSKIALSESRRPVTIEDIVAVLNEVRQNALLTPQVCPPGLWLDHANHVPGEQVERHIQWGVAVALRTSFRPVQVDIENITAVGRIDILFTNPLPVEGDPICPAVIELKAFRSYSTSKKPTAKRASLLAALSGVRQISAYSKVRNAPIGLLACFDLREKKDDVLGHPFVVAAKAKYFGTGLKAEAFPIYADVAEAQAEFASATKH